jgi:hypothetical protein
MTLREINALFTDPSISPEKRTAKDIIPEVLELLLDAQLKTVVIKGIDEIGEVKDKPDRMFAYFANSNKIGFTFSKTHFVSWDGPTERNLKLFDIPANVTAMDSSRIKQSFDASKISELFGQNKLSTYTAEHR